MNTNSIRVLAVGLCLGVHLNLFADTEPEKVSSVTFSQGKVQALKEDKAIDPTNDVIVASVALVQTNGAFRVNKGKERQLTEGQTIDSDGMLTSPDGSVTPIVDHLIVKNGRVQVVKDGVASPLAGEFALPDASKVTADATQRMRDGRLRRLLDGQTFKLDGTSIPVTDTASLQGGKVVLFKDGGRIELRRGQFMAMSDGSKVSGDGYVIKADGSRVNLKEGEILKLEGVSTLNR
jgi:hypothetical protein